MYPPISWNRVGEEEYASWNREGEGRMKNTLSHVCDFQTMLRTHICSTKEFCLEFHLYLWLHQQRDIDRKGKFSQVMSPERPQDQVP